MAFRETSAWIMSGALLLCGAFYGLVVVGASMGIGRIAPPFPPVVVLAVILLIIISVVGHTVAAILNPKDANARSDEREKAIANRAGHLSGMTLGFGVVASLCVYLFCYDGFLLFHSVAASLFVAQLTEYATQIVLYRTSL